MVPDVLDCVTEVAQMESTVAAAYVELHPDEHPKDQYPKGEAHSSGVSWGAVIGGAFVAASFYLILLALGAGLGLSAVSPWTDVGASASAVGTAAVIWLIFIEIVASALGGYLTGRLRTKWALIHTDEVYFRDTANGFLAWAVALVISVTLLATAAASMVGRAAQLRPPLEAAATSGPLDPSAYFVDALFRSGSAGSENADVALRAEAGRIFTNALRQNEIPDADRSYLTHLIAAGAGISEADAEKRVSDVFANARQAEDTARKATAHLLLWLFLALLMGAFSASYAATIGGRQRDHVKVL
jgi:hypothetical protein